MNTEALKQMIRVLEAVQADAEKREHFDLSTWLDTGLTQSTLEVVKGAPMECGTVACACGHAALDPWFQQQGFSITAGEITACPRFGGETGWEAVRLFFDLDYDQTQYLFSISYYRDEEDEEIDVTPQMVIDRINKLLNGA